MLITATTVNETDKNHKKKDYIPAEVHQDVMLPDDGTDQFKCTLFSLVMNDIDSKK